MIDKGRLKRIFGVLQTASYSSNGFSIAFRPPSCPHEAPQLRRPLNLIRLKELAEPQAVGGVWGRGGSAGWPGLGSSHVRVQEAFRVRWQF